MQMSINNLWQDTITDQFSAQQLKGNLKADVVIVGAGFTGLSAALHLAQEGAKVCVLEAHTVGFGGSGRNVGYVNAGLWTPPDEVEEILGLKVGKRLNSVLADGPDVVFDLIKRHQIQCSAVRQATLHCSETQSGLNDLKSRYEQQVARGAPVKLLSREETQEKTGSPKLLGALWDPRAGTIQPLSYAHGLARAAVNAGADIFENTQAISFEQQSGRWNVFTNSGCVTANYLIQATNAYGGFGISKNEFIPVHYFQMATEPLSKEQRKRILPGGEGCWDCATVMSSYRLDKDGRMLIGAVGNLESFGGSTHEAWAKRKLSSLFPDLNDLNFQHAWYGRIAMTSDHLPKVVNIGPKAISIFGYSGRGISPGTVFGKCAAAWVVHQDLDAFPIPISKSKVEPIKNTKALFYEAGSTITHLVSNRIN